MRQHFSSCLQRSRRCARFLARFGLTLLTILLLETVATPFLTLAQPAPAPSPTVKPAPKPASYMPASYMPLRRIIYPAAFPVALNPQSFVPKGRRLDSPSRSVVGTDQRKPLTSRSYPWSAIGRIDGWEPETHSFVHFCTGTLIQSNLVLTNAHCVTDPDSKMAATALQFKPNYFNGYVGGVPGNEGDIAQVKAAYVGTIFPEGQEVESIADDWALLELDRPLGNKYGTVGWSAIPTAKLAQMGAVFYLAGYSGDFPAATPGETPGLHSLCRFEREAEVEAGKPVVLHQCDTQGGASGSSILMWQNNQYQIVALHRGAGEHVQRVNPSYTRAANNMAVQVSRIQSEIQQWQKH